MSAGRRLRRGRLWSASEGDPVEEGAVRKHERQETQDQRLWLRSKLSKMELRVR